MTRRSRITAFGSVGLLVVAGVACVVVIAGGVGQVLGLVLIGLGLVLATSLVFLEVGLSEDRERARETGGASRRRVTRPRSPRLDRSRGHRRRLK